MTQTDAFAFAWTQKAQKAEHGCRRLRQVSQATHMIGVVIRIKLEHEEGLIRWFWGDLG